MAALAAAFLMTSCLDSVDGVSGSFSYDGGKYVINDAKYGYNSFHLGSYGQYIDLYVPEDGKTVELIPGNEKKWSVSINLEDLVLSADNTNPGDVVDGRITWRRSGYDYFEVSFDIRLESGKRLLGGCSGIFPVAVVD
ncbi:MAG: hypothetical protein LBU80_04985 [Rikenellaceae bacterium]|nr:hypothetical protein [Rikenellaceae bacterium]